MQIVHIGADEVIQFPFSKDMIIPMVDLGSAASLRIQGLRRARNQNDYQN